MAEFHRIEDKPAIENIDDVVWFAANDDELILIRNRFDNIPITKGNYCRWKGEMAYFIFANLQP